MIRIIVMEVFWLIGNKSLIIHDKYFYFKQNAILHSLMVKTRNNQCMRLLKRWFKTSERPRKIHLNGVLK